MRRRFPNSGRKREKRLGSSHKARSTKFRPHLLLASAKKWKYIFAIDPGEVKGGTCLLDLTSGKITCGSIELREKGEVISDDKLVYNIRRFIRSNIDIFSSTETAILVERQFTKRANILIEGSILAVVGERCCSIPPQTISAFMKPFIQQEERHCEHRHIKLPSTTYNRKKKLFTMAIQRILKQLRQSSALPKDGRIHDISDAIAIALYGQSCIQNE